MKLNYWKVLTLSITLGIISIIASDGNPELARLLVTSSFVLFIISTCIENEH